MKLPDDRINAFGDDFIRGLVRVGLVKEMESKLKLLKGLGRLLKVYGLEGESLDLGA